MTASTSTTTPGWKRSRFGIARFQYISLLVAQFALRLCLFFAFKSTGTVTAWEVIQTFILGFVLDAFVALLLVLPWLIWMWIVPFRWFRATWHRIVFSAALWLFWLIQIFLVIAEFFFFEEFKSRFNTVSVDYLLYPHEVFINIRDSYPVNWVVAGCALIALAWVIAANKLFREVWATPSMPAPPRGGKLLLSAIAAAVIGALILPNITARRNSFTDERLLKELANNGSIAFFTAAWTHHLEFAAFYKTIPGDEAFARTRKMLTQPDTTFVGDVDSIQRRVAGDANRPRLNVVLLLEESLGSEFWGSLGRPGPTLTPEMDKLANEEGMLFTNIYACGNRTVRGMEGVLSSFPPLPGDSIVKRDRSENVETIARVLKRDGYDTVFLYGGRGLFDGMRAFTVANGFDRFVEQKHFENPTFTTIWGVCDEDIMNRAIAEFREMHKSGKPFFGTVLSVSNHKPYTYPKGRIPEDPEQRIRENAVKYSDYALGQFFKAARKEAFWTNTIFAVVADHGARVYGSQSIPIKSYEIPVLLAGPAIVKSPVRMPQLGSSLDVAPTLLGLIGRPYDTMFYGRNLLHSAATNAQAVLHHNRDIGLYRDGRLVVLGLRHDVEFYQGDPKKVDMTRLAKPSAEDLEQERDTIAIFQTADELYTNRRYRVKE